MGSQLPAGGQGGLTPETLAALQQMGGMAAMPQAQAPPVQMPAVPLPNVQPQPQGGFMSSIADMIGKLFLGGTSAKELAAPPQAGGALSPMELQQQRDRLKQLAPPQ
jgi:hypothetical protein